MSKYYCPPNYKGCYCIRTDGYIINKENEKQDGKYLPLQFKNTSVTLDKMFSKEKELCFGVSMYY